MSRRAGCVGCAGVARRMAQGGRTKQPVGGGQRGGRVGSCMQCRVCTYTRAHLEKNRRTLHDPTRRIAGMRKTAPAVDARTPRPPQLAAVFAPAAPPQGTHTRERSESRGRCTPLTIRTGFLRSHRGAPVVGCGLSDARALAPVARNHPPRAVGAPEAASAAHRARAAAWRGERRAGQRQHAPRRRGIALVAGSRYHASADSGANSKGCVFYPRRCVRWRP